jgi:hypothetical protein
VIASLWQVGDQSVKPMIDLLYTELASGASVGDALHRARRTARARGLSPAVWAAFTLTGDARVITDLHEPTSFAPVYVASAGLLALAALYFGARTRKRRSADRR